MPDASRSVASMIRYLKRRSNISNSSPNTYNWYIKRERCFKRYPDTWKLYIKHWREVFLHPILKHGKEKYKTRESALNSIECFHTTPGRPYWCPKTMKRRPYWCPKTGKRRPYWCPKLILWELNSFLAQTLSFVPINLHRCWPREWKHSIPSHYKVVY